ncbi:MAG: recombinase family protein [Candidatus Nanopelagicales bacterium]
MTIIDADRTAIDSLVAPTPFPGSFAVSYLRVSTKEQAEKGGQAEGFSIPAQREANQRKADQLGATIIEEFVDAGESARKADRPELMRMIQYVAKHKTNYCIVHKVDRLARNRADDVTIHLALKDAGVTLVSATENIDETPSGMLLHGIMSSIAEFYSRNLATEVVKGLSQKAAQGGTVTKAPIGYRNVGVRDEFGREVRTVEIDEERARLVRWAFQVFASGDWTTSQLHQELVARGLTTAASPRRPSRPIGKSSVHRMLTNPYYKGSVRYQGVTYAGAHEAIVPNEVWDQVQTVLGTHRSAADATQVHEHYLKGTVFCGQCGSRLLVCNAKSSQGTIYPYFVCASRHGGRGDCTRQAMLIEQVERLIERFYAKVQLDPETIAGGLGDDPCQVRRDDGRRSRRTRRPRVPENPARRRAAEAAPSSLRRSHPARPAQEGAGPDHRVVGDHRAPDHRAPRPLRRRAGEPRRLAETAVQRRRHLRARRRREPPAHATKRCSRRSTSTRTTTCASATATRTTG